MNQPGAVSPETLKARLIHGVVPGRARIAVQGLRGHPQLARRLERRLRQMSGVMEASASHLTGNLLLHFRPEQALGPLLHAAGMSLAPPDESAAPAKPTHMMEAASALIEPLLERGFALAEAVRGQLAGRARSPAAIHPSAQLIRPWHAMPLEKVLQALETTPDGLPAERIAPLLERYGPNALPEAERPSELVMLGSQFASLPVLLLGVSAAISVATGGRADAAVILGVVLINAGIGFFTERQSERTISALLQGPALHAKVLRDGLAQTVPAAELVPGDVILLEPGTRIPADARLLYADALSVDESSLTGESLPVLKSATALCQEDTALGDRLNMIYHGALVTGGSAKGVVTATGPATEIGIIQQLAGEARVPETPMQRQLDDLGTQLALISGAVCAGVFALGLLRGYGMLPMLKSAVSLAVAAVPEGLPTVATTTLALGIREMYRRQVAIRKLAAVETLGAVQTFCMDKTGTLTENRMQVVTLIDGVSRHKVEKGRVDGMEDGAARQLLHAMTLCNDTRINGSGRQPELDGSPTETALVDLALAQGIDVHALHAAHPRLDARYRAEGRPWMTTLHRQPQGGALIAVKGSPAEVLAMCNDALINGRLTPLDASLRKRILEHNEAMAGEALRVLAVAFANTSEESLDVALPLTWLGMVGLADPLREGMRELIERFHAAGVDTVMITGDQSATAQAIGRELNLSNGAPLQILDASSLEKVDEALLAALVKKVHVFARVSPRHKLRIVQALQRSGRVVAMTGDGINDGPALKAADIGVAMGKDGSDVARSMADVVLEDDNLHTMTTAISLGRTIYANIRKSVHFLLATNFSEIELMVAGIALGLGQPVTPIQLLWINLATDIFPDLALAMEPAEPGVMERAPRNPAEPIIRRADLGWISLESAMITAGTLASHIAASRVLPPGHAGTVAFTSLTLAQLLHATTCRSDRHGLFIRRDLPRNRWLEITLGASAFAQLALPYLPPTRALFGLSPLGPTGIALSLAGAGLPLIVNEAIKAARLRLTDHSEPTAKETPP